MRDKNLLFNEEMKNVARISFGMDTERFHRDDDYVIDDMRWVMDKFCKMSIQIDEGNYLGIRVELDKEDDGNVFVYSSDGVEIEQGDYEWVMSGCSVKMDVEEVSDYCPLEFDENDVHVYSLECDELEEASRRTSEFWKEVVKELSDSKSVIRMVYGTEGTGEINIITEKKLSLKLRSQIASTSANAMLVETVGGDEASFQRKMSLKSFKHYSSAFMAGLIISNKSDFVDLESIEDIFVDDTMDGNDPFESSIHFTDDTPISELELGIRAYNCLMRAGITTYGVLRLKTTEELMKVRNLGRKCMEQVKEQVKWAEEYYCSDTNVQSVEKAKGRKKERNYSEELSKLIGLTEAKEQIKKIEAYARFKHDMEQAGKNNDSIALNMEFIGNPGTAKTTVARLLAGILYEIGLISSPEAVEVGRDGLVAEYIGQTAVKVKKLFASAKGKLLFVDEAYSLVDSHENSYGDEAINTIIQEMENNRKDTVVVFAGYPDKMKAFMAKNPGLSSRVPFCISFKDYSKEELLQIAQFEADNNDFELSDGAKGKILSLCDQARQVHDFGNGRFSRNLVQNAIINFAARVYVDSDSHVDAEHLVLEEQDFEMPEEIKHSISEIDNKRAVKAVQRIGFTA